MTRTILSNPIVHAEMVRTPLGEVRFRFVYSGTDEKTGGRVRLASGGTYPTANAALMAAKDPRHGVGA